MLFLTYAILTPLLICRFPNILVGVGTQSFLVHMLVGKFMILNSKPGDADQLLGKPPTFVKVIQLLVALVNVEHIELCCCDLPLAVCVSLLGIPAVGSMWKEQGEMKGHPLRVKVRDRQQFASSLLQNQAMWLDVGQDTDLL